MDSHEFCLLWNFRDWRWGVNYAILQPHKSQTFFLNSLKNQLFLLLRPTDRTRFQKPFQQPEGKAATKELQWHMPPAEPELEPILFVPRSGLESDPAVFQMKTGSQHCLQKLRFLKQPGGSQGMDALTVTHIVFENRGQACSAHPTPPHLPPCLASS